MFFVLFILIFFINSTKYVFFVEQKLFFRIQFPNTIFFLKTQKTVLKNCSKKLFFIIVLKNSNQTTFIFWITKIY